MADVENVIYAIERCTCHVPDACRDCPYDAGHPYNECIEMLLKDAMELLKEQEAVKPSVDVDTYVCPNCGHRLEVQGKLGDNVIFDERYNFCPACGKAVKWDDSDRNGNG